MTSASCESGELDVVNFESDGFSSDQNVCA